jgi:4-amino-4-deoxy-L-arabinose transferase-like glycosyltransferase
MISYGSLRRISDWLPLTAILAVAAAARLWYLTAGVPHAVGIDEPIVVDHALRILQTGDWNPHVFNYPSLVIYFQAGVEILRFLWGAVHGEWAALDRFDMLAVYQAARFATAVVGVATVWLTFELGRELSGRPVALLAAAQMAVRPMHVRESHYALTDVPMTALVTLALWLTVRAMRRRAVVDYALAGMAAGLAAAAKYTGGVAFAGVVVAWALAERSSPRRGRTLLAAAGAAALAFAVTTPYSWLDLPSFLNGFASLFAQYSVPSGAADPAWRVYAKHLWMDGAIALVTALAALPIVFARRSERQYWVPVVAVAVLHFYALSTHSHMFGRYALPLLPIVCVLSSVTIVALLRFARLSPALARPWPRRAVAAAAILIVLTGPTVAAVRWLDQSKRPDTRTMAADWLQAHAPRGARVAVENSGPTYLGAAGFRVTPTELLLEHDVAWYRQHVDYLIVSATDRSHYGDLLSAGATVYQVTPTLQRWGPPVQIVALHPPAAQ